MKKPKLPCQTGDPDMWFPISENAVNTITLAKALCSVCPIRQACLDRALTEDYRDGIWGGLTAKERIQIQIRRGVSANVREEAGPAFRRALASA